MRLFDSTMNQIEQSMNYAANKNRVIGNNIANLDTPNYKSKEVVFKNTLNNAMKELQLKQTNVKHMNKKSASEPFVVRSTNNTSYNHNGNNVDVDKEMAELAKNQIYYRALVDRMNGKFNTLSTVIRGGK